MSSCLSNSNGSSTHNITASTAPELGSSSVAVLRTDAEYDYTDSEIVVEGIPVGILSIGLADLNLKNTRGHTVLLHVAARRKEPSILVALLINGACTSKTTLDWQTVVAICQKLTRPKEFNVREHVILITGDS
ncbi:hypothetical protein EZV62_019778 [Acer yangbiense]|uniref:Uncharacterized protein n=1 Tax=Acer yangbiense TaxID=1000413 RepID=A0A5C7HDG3_9ROSI|nr:hypothetical protein EZV62_019778 [Acer yangbiense]